MGNNTSSNAFFLKKHGTQVHEDWNRVRRFHNAANLTSSLLAPHPIEKRANSEEIAYGRMDCSRPIFTESRGDPELFSQFGAALFDLHASTNLTSTSLDIRIDKVSRFGLPTDQAADLASAFPNGFCHGDCWHGNVFNTADHRFILLDPIPAPLMRKWMPEYAPGCIDLAYFCASLFLGHNLLRSLSLDARFLNGIAKMTIDGYNSQSRNTFPAQAFNKLCMSISELWISHFPIRLAYPFYLAKTKVAIRLIRNAFFFNGA